MRLTGIRLLSVCFRSLVNDRIRVFFVLLLFAHLNCANKNKTDSNSLLGLLLLNNTQSHCTIEKQVSDELSFNPTISEGVWGSVWFMEGNFMPTVTSSQPCAKEANSDSSITRVHRKILFYEPTGFRDVVSHTDPTFYTQIQTQILGQTESDENGFFQIGLPMGEYSIFILEKLNGEEYYYANLFDGQGRIQTVEVLRNQKLRKDIFINYKAFY